MFNEWMNDERPFKMATTRLKQDKSFRDTVSGVLRKSRDKTGSGTIIMTQKIFN